MALRVVSRPSPSRPSPSRPLASACCLALVWAVGCGGKKEVEGAEPLAGDDDAPSAETPEPVPTVTEPAPVSSQPDPDDLIADDDGAVPEPVAEPEVVTPRDPCLSASCGVGQRCDGSSGAAVCVDNTCPELACGATELCVPAEGGGNVCQDNGCTDDVDCSVEQYCDSVSGSCQADACVAEVLRCEALTVLQCDSAGREEQLLHTCGSPAHFDSACAAQGTERTGCTCEDDWDCPAFTNCDVDLCQGTGRAPTCTLPPTPFADTPPAVEIHWGGDAANDSSARDGTAARNPSPFPEFAHVEATPMVANLDDDNGDGFVNELDFPEIIFVSYRPGSGADAVVRAIHGGGPNKGADLWAYCGDVVWHRDTPSAQDCAAPVVRTQTPVSVGDLDQDGVPEIVFVDADYGLRVLNARGEEVLVTEPGIVDDADPGGSVAIANLDFAGLPELVAGGSVVTLAVDETTGALRVEYVLTSAAAQGRNAAHVADDGAIWAMGPTSCVADLSPDVGQEILAGTALYRLPTLAACATPPCAGALEVVWDAAVVNTLPAAESDGYCAVADVWGADPLTPPGPANAPDGVAEAILIADGILLILDSLTGTVVHRQELGGGTQGGAPNVDDFDGDGFMEIASALSDFYVVVDLQTPTTSCPAWPELLPRLDLTLNPNLDAGLARAPGAATCVADTDCGEGAVCNTQAAVCVCLHNGWMRESDDASSKITSSSVFDFNGDGASEVLYNDECDFRVYDGIDGTVLYSEVSRSRTAMENPIVADVDNDGNAEAVTVLNTETSGRCDDDTGAVSGPNGLRVWGDPTDTWVAARRIWNQFAYHVTNVTEGGAIPLREPESWLEYEGRRYNTYRSQPRSYGVAPDLVVTGVSLSSPDVACGELSDTLLVAFEVENQGDLRVGPGVVVSFYGTWAGMERALLGPDGQPLTYVIMGSLEPGRALIGSVEFGSADQGETALPDSVRVVVDSGGADGSAFGAERECNEDNNELAADVEPGEPRPDLTIAVGAASVNCATHTATVEVTITNSGNAEATGIVVEIFRGDPSSGGTSMHRESLPEPLAAMGTVTVSIEVPGIPEGSEITLWGVVDPDDTIAECNEADNSDPADNPIQCPRRPAGAR